MVMSLTTDRLLYKLQTRPLVKEGAPEEKQSNCPAKERKKKNLLICKPAPQNTTGKRRKQKT
jgi:hypothetical protein